MSVICISVDKAQKQKCNIDSLLLEFDVDPFKA